MNHKYLKMDGKILLVGFGSIGQAVLPLILKHIILILHKLKLLQLMILTRI